MSKKIYEKPLNNKDKYSKYLLISDIEKIINDRNEVSLDNLLNDKRLNSEDKIYKIKNTITNRNVDIKKVPANKEWMNSVYTYNKNYSKPLIIASNFVNKLLNSYFNINVLTNGKKSRVLAILERKLTLNKVLVSKTEVKHTNNKVNITMYIYNRNKETLLKDLNLNNDSFFKSLYNKTLKELLPKSLNSNKVKYYKIGELNNYAYKLLGEKVEINEMSSLNSSMKEEIIMKKKFLSPIRKIRLNKKNIFNKLKNIKINALNTINKSNVLNNRLKTFTEQFSKYELDYLLDCYTIAYEKEILNLYYKKALLLNKNKFKNWFMLGIKKTLSFLYNKKVELNIVNQKYFYMNSDIFVKAITTRAKKRKSKITNIMIAALSCVKVAKRRLSYYSKLNEENSLFNPYEVVKLNPFNVTPYKLNNIIKPLSENLFDSVKYKHIQGIRIEAAGRLSRRLIAARTTFSLRYKGNLINASHVFGHRVLPLRGRFKPNLQYTLVNSKTRNGAFGIRGWINNN